MNHCSSKEERKARGMRHFVGARLHRRVFVGMGLAIFLTFFSAGLALHWLGGDSPFKGRRDAIEAFAAGRFAAAWDDEKERNSLAMGISEAFGVALLLRDNEKRTLLATLGGCDKPWAKLLVPSDIAHKKPRGSVSLCRGPFAGGSPSHIIWALFIAAMVLWFASGVIARRLGRPLWKLVQVTTKIGDGDLSARVRLGRHREGEVGVLSESINRMAERIDKQMSDQRALLAGVSHEIRTPLARLRIITELLREKSGDQRLLDDAEREIAEVDDLTGQLLATSRLEFVAHEGRQIDAKDLCAEALRRASLSPELLDNQLKNTTIEADPTLIGRALSNLLRNALDHGGQPVKLSICERKDRVCFEVTDNGPGFKDGESSHVFEAFVQGASTGSISGGATLGLGLALVKRIAEAHGGAAYLENRPGGGATVGFSISRIS